MNPLTRMGVDVAKQVFQLHGVDRHEQPAWRRRLSRDRWLGAVVEAAPPGALRGDPLVRSQRAALDVPSLRARGLLPKDWAGEVDLPGCFGER